MTERRIGVRSRRDTVVGWLLVAVAAPIMMAAGIAGLLLFPTPHGAGHLERLLHLPAFVAGAASVSVGILGGQLLRRGTPDQNTTDDG